MKWTDVEIWRRLLEMEGLPVYAEILCYDFGMTRRQLLARTSALEQYLPIKEVSGKDVIFRIQAPMDDKVQATAEVLGAFYRCPPDKILMIVNAVPIAGYLSLEEISVLTGVPTKDLIYTLRVMPNVDMRKDLNKKNYYIRRDTNVPIDMGTADTRAQFA